jgi:hypothetical protein
MASSSKLLNGCSNTTSSGAATNPPALACSCSEEEAKNLNFSFLRKCGPGLFKAQAPWELSK